MVYVKYQSLYFYALFSCRNAGEETSMLKFLDRWPRQVGIVKQEVNAQNAPQNNKYAAELESGNHRLNSLPLCCSSSSCVYLWFLIPDPCKEVQTLTDELSFDWYLTGPYHWLINIMIMYLKHYYNIYCVMSINLHSIILIDWYFLYTQLDVFLHL